MIISHLSHSTISSKSEEAFSLHEKSCWGEKNKDRIEYSLAEALSLLEEGKIEVYSGSKKLSFESLLKKAKKIDKRIETKLAAFSDLRKRGYIIKTALKFGADFRVYEKGIRPGQDHAVWLLYPVKEHEILTWHDFAAKNRVATSTKKKLLIAIVDDEKDVTYYQIEWLRP